MRGKDDRSCKLMAAAQEELGLSAADMAGALGLKSGLEWSRLKYGGRVTQRTMARIAVVLGARRWARLCKEWE